MNDQPSSPTSSAEQSDELSAGDMLRQLREAAGEDIGTLARALKVPIHKLKALESDDHDIFPDVVIMRGIAASICRHFKANPAPVLACLPDFAPTRLMTNDLSESFNDDRQPRFDSHSKSKGFKLGPVGIAVGLLLLAAAAVAFLPLWEDPWGDSYLGQRQTAFQQPATAEQSSAVSTVVEPLATAPRWSSQQVEITESTQPVVPSPNRATEQQPALPQETTPVPTATAAPTPDAPVAPETNETAHTAVLLLRANAASWIQIRNVAGESLVQRLLPAGESIIAPGEPPWSVVVGNATETEVIVRGVPMDVSKIAREGVARFEVK